MKRNKLIYAIVMVCSVAVMLVSGAILAFSATRQNVTSNLTVTYVANNVNFTASSFYQVSGESATTNLVNVADSNNTTLTFIASDTSGTKDLSTPEPVTLTANNTYVLFTYTFTNTASSGAYDMSVSLADNSVKSHVVTKYLAGTTMYYNNADSDADKIADLAAQKLLVTGATAPTNVVISAGATKYFYVLVELEDPDLTASLYQQFCQWPSLDSQPLWK